MESSINLPVYECQIGFLNSNQIIITDEVLTQTVLLGMIGKVLYSPTMVLRKHNEDCYIVS